MVVRIYLTGEMCLLGSGRILRAERLPGRQGRLAFAYLVAGRARPVPRDELAAAVWPEQLPRAHEVAISAIVSKLRALLESAGLDRHALTTAAGCVRLNLPPEAWVDTETAIEAVHAAEGALRSESYTAAYGPAVVAAAILRRPYLPGLEGDWVEAQRTALRAAHVRTLDVLSEIHALNREPGLALRAGEEAIDLEPLRESGYRNLMRLHLKAGDRAQALDTYERCKDRLRTELGIEPAAETDALRDQVLVAR